MAYLSVTEYLVKFGQQETVRLTNTAAPAPGTTPQVDTAKVQDALDDATEVVDGYVGKRYRTPIIDPPRIARGWVAALAREALHVNTGKSVQAVKEAADLARSQLRDLVRGDLSIPVEEGGEPPEEKGQGTARTSNDRASPTFSGGGALDSFVAPFTGGGYGRACWKG